MFQDPELQAQLKAEERLKKNKQRMEAFLNNTLSVSKAGLNPHFNSISKEKETNFVRAVIDSDFSKEIEPILSKLSEKFHQEKNIENTGMSFYMQHEKNQEKMEHLHEQEMETHNLISFIAGGRRFSSANEGHKDLTLQHFTQGKW